MELENCIFCKIANNNAPSFKVYEDDKFIAFLDIKPSTKGMTVLASKKHLPSEIYSNETELLKDSVVAAQKTAQKLKQALKCERVLTLAEGLDVQHFHLKLFPYYTERSTFETLKQPLDPVPTMEELKELADEINSL